LSLLNIVVLHAVNRKYNYQDLLTDYSIAS